jgi:hypothetical protein
MNCRRVRVGTTMEPGARDTFPLPRRGDFLKITWCRGWAEYLLSKQLKHGRFIWSMPSDDRFKRMNVGQRRSETL